MQLLNDLGTCFEVIIITLYDSNVMLMIRTLILLKHIFKVLITLKHLRVDSVSSTGRWKIITFKIIFEMVSLILQGVYFWCCNKLTKLLMGIN